MWLSNVTSSVSILHQLGLTDCGLMAAMDNEIFFWRFSNDRNYLSFQEPSQISFYLHN
jgi:hypothetical protein